MIKLKIDILFELRQRGYTSYKLRQDKLIGESVLTKLRAGKLTSWHELDTICRLLDRQPGDLLEYKPDTSQASIQESETVMAQGSMSNVKTD